jgi:hypothetical protein
MDRHVRICGILNMVFGIGGFLAAVLALMVFGGFRGLYAAFDGSVLQVISVLMVGFQLVISLPCVIAGRFVMDWHDWARVLLIICSALNVLNFPFGSALGGYSLWVLLEPETDPLFRDPPNREGRAPKKKAAVKPKAKSSAATAGEDAKNSSILPLESRRPSR